MPTLTELQDRSRKLFTALLADEHPSPRARRRAVASVPVGQPRSFSWFNPGDAQSATILAAELAARSGSAAAIDDGLEAALDLAEQRRGEDPPGLILSALSMFVTHHKPARQLGQPRPVTARPAAFTRSRPRKTVSPVRRQPRRALTTGSVAEAGLDYWREDAFANEHHWHWHMVYPFSGLIPSDWEEWAATTDRSALLELFQSLDPQPGQLWADFLAQNPAAEIAGAFLQRFNQLPDRRLFVRQLNRVAYGALFRLNDRQGELFVYMHSQMLARYDAERRSAGLPAVGAFGPPYTDAQPDGYDPAPLAGYVARPPGVGLSQDSSDLLTALHAELKDAIDNQTLLAPTTTAVPIDRTIIGEAVEAAEPRLRTPMRDGRYLGWHNTGHVRIARLSTVPPGSTARAVMGDPQVAIRDPIFWRWHKGIDDLAVAWQNTQDPYDFADAPAVVVRDQLDGQPPAAWSSPDLFLVRRPRFTDATAAPERIAAALSGTNADIAVGDGTIRNLRGYRFTSELTTRFESLRLGAQNVRYLTHDPFGYAVRIGNLGPAETLVTVRVFLAPADTAEQRTSWIELDKVLHAVPAGATSVLYRPDTEFSVIKRPAEPNLDAATAAGTDPDDDAYCTCGWPWTLVVPRGTPEGMPFRLAVVCTDATLDQVPAPSHCGSMSYCGAVDRYPDTRDMGYPFARPFPNGIATAVLAQPTAAGRSLTIRHDIG